MMQLHPFCDLFPEYLPGPLKELSDNIKQDGQLDDILTFPMPGERADGLVEHGILDGRNRYLACEMAGIEPRTRPFKGTVKQALAYVVSKNLLPGRQLTAMQRAEIAAKVRKIANPESATPDETPSQREVADLFGVSRSTLQRAEAKSRPAPVNTTPHWSVEDAKKDPPLFSAFKTIADCYGNEDTKAIRTGIIGLTRAEIIFLAALPTEKMKECRDLVIGDRWTPKQALEFLGKMPTDDSTVRDLKYLCRATKGQFYTGDFDGFTVTVKNNRAPRR